MDYRLSRQRTDAFIDALNDILFGWNTTFTVNSTEEDDVFDIRVRDLFWNRVISFKLNIRFWTLFAFDANDKINFNEMHRISNSIYEIFEEMKKRFGGD